MYPAERHKWLIDTARETGRVSVAEASTALGVVPETIRRDLDQLCNQKMLRRVHGGAIPIEFDLLGDQPLATGLLGSDAEGTNRPGGTIPST